jgi:hypothetical protein
MIWVLEAATTYAVLKSRDAMEGFQRVRFARPRIDRRETGSAFARGRREVPNGVDERPSERKTFDAASPDRRIPREGSSADSIDGS